MPQLTPAHDVSEHADSLADYLPNGPLFVAKKVCQANLRLFLEGLAETLRKAEEDINLTTSEYDITTTTLFIEEWEGFVGIPDDCFDTNATLDQRRRNVLIKLASLGVQTAQDFIDLAAIFGVVVTITPGSEEGEEFFDMDFPVLLSLDNKTAAFTMIVNFDVPEGEEFTYIFPLPFGNELLVILECLFNKIKPANVQVIFRQV